MPTKPRPTQATYRYRRGSEGWTSSPVASNAWNAAVPGEPNEKDYEPDAQTETFDEIAAFIPTHAGTIEAPRCDQANVDRQASEWDDLWETQQPYVNPMFDLKLDMFKGLASSVIPVAATFFLADTGLGGDNMAPRAFTRLSEESISALADLFIAYE